MSPRLYDGTDFYQVYFARSGFVFGTVLDELALLCHKFNIPVRRTEKEEQVPNVISAICADILFSLYDGMKIWNPDPSVVEALKCLLIHRNPHIDEYFSTLLFRSCLPYEKRTIPVCETQIKHMTHDEELIDLWPSAAVFGIGGTHNGGAVPLLLFDEHVTDGKQRNVFSSAMLIKRQVFGSQQVPASVYPILNEVDHIDGFGGAHPKNLGAYAKYLQTVPLMVETDDNLRMYAFVPVTWKQAIVDVCIVAFILGVQNDGRALSDTVWMPETKESMKDFARHTLQRNHPYFNNSFSYVNQLLSKNFVEGMRSEKNLLTIATGNGRIPKTTKAGVTTKQIMLMPFLPSLLKKYFGEVLSKFVLMPMWDVRIAREIENATVKNILSVTTGDEDIINAELDIGRISMLHLEKQTVGEKNQTWLIEITTEIISSPTALKNYLFRANSGDGYVIFKNAVYGTIYLGKGSAIDEAEWRAVCDQLLQSEGSSNIELNAENSTCGCWHLTHNERGIADFLLNGNPSHLYVPRSSLTVFMLRAMVTTIRSKRSELEARLMGNDMENRSATQERID